MAARFVPVVHGGSESRPDEADTIRVAGEIARALERLGYRSALCPLRLNLGALEQLARNRPYAVFNMVEALDGNGALAPIAAMAMEHFGLVYTGCSAAALNATLSKVRVKQELRAAGLPTPDWWRPERESAELADRVIVKSEREHASLGLDHLSVVSGVDAAAEIARREAKFGGCFFAEAFIEGREFNLGMIEDRGEPHLLPIPEMVFVDWRPDRPRIVDYAAKWDERSSAYNDTKRSFGIETEAPQIAAEMRRLALACWQRFGLGGYARIDMRLDASGQPYIIDLNSNPSLARDAGLAMTAQHAGISFDELVETILDAATRSTGK